MKKKTIIKWMLSYLYILALPLVFGICIYAFSMNMIREEAEEIQYRAVATSADTLEGLLNTLSQMGAALVSDDKVADIGRVKNGAFNSQQRLYFQDVNTKLLDYAVSNDYISSVYLYLPNSNYLIGARNLYFTYEDQMIKGSLKIPADVFESMTHKTAWQNLQLLPGINKPVLLYCYALNTGKIMAEQDVVMLVTLNYEKILRNIQLSDTSVYLAIAGEGIVGTDQIPEDDYSALLEQMEAEGNYLYQREGENNLVIYRLTKNDLYLINKIPRGMYMEKLQKSMLILAAYVLVCLFVSVFLAGVFSKRNYSPVDELLQMTQHGKYRSSNSDEEFQAIKESVEKLIEVYDNQEEEKLSREYQLQENRMRRILENTRFAMVSQEEFERLTAHFVYDSFMLLDFNISDISDIFVEEQDVVSEDTWHLISFIINNVCAELLDGKYPYLSGAWGKDFVFLLNVDDRDEDSVYQDVIRIAERMGEFMKESYGLNLWINISAIHKGRQDIAMCRDEVNDMNLFRDWEGTSQMVLCFRDIADSDEGNYVGTYNKEKKARDLIRFHEYGEAIAVLSTLQSGQQNVPDEEITEDTETGKPAGSMMAEIAEYIDQHYTDKMLSAGQLADIFDISPSNLSQTFKRKMNIGLLDYINQARLKKAKELLQAGRTVKDTADEVGYYTTRPLIRVFYSVEGVSPAEYRAKYVVSHTDGKE